MPSRSARRRRRHATHGKPARIRRPLVPVTVRPLSLLEPMTVPQAYVLARSVMEAERWRSPSWYQGDRERKLLTWPHGMHDDICWMSRAIRRWMEHSRLWQLYGAAWDRKPRSIRVAASLAWPSSLQASAAAIATWAVPGGPATGWRMGGYESGCGMTCRWIDYADLTGFQDSLRRQCRVLGFGEIPEPPHRAPASPRAAQGVSETWWPGSEPSKSFGS